MGRQTEFGSLWGVLQTRLLALLCVLRQLRLFGCPPYLGAPIDSVHLSDFADYVIMGPAVPELRSTQAARAFNLELARVDYDLEAWR